MLYYFGVGTDVVKNYESEKVCARFCYRLFEPNLVLELNMNVELAYYHSKVKIFLKLQYIV